MIFPRVRRILTVLLLCGLLFTTACTPKTPGRFDQAQQQSSQQKSGQAIAKDSTQGAEFNKFFPKPQDGYERVYTQEKKGFSEAKLKKAGKEVAVISISDTQGVKGTANPAGKFKTSTKTIGGFPSVSQGSNGTAILVGSRYQVKVQSRDPSFTESDREAWLEKFNLDGLSRLK
ncbi:hypothetical protein G7B40_014370 [Aetokthonos hydrillicola Thurmond2011]|jgi:hypothetical protein|uniref:Uncharacterized protein n=1 Tax=Aetokthonos hydrillicola Thurmond2011 TaxID=2712845 RepID=A0AAP5I6J3_9CYAN|nr:hypothetical protein [Aetokthonos hydrillicola]MBO3464003.1 hypothetical protein [Aetokthonos hydrillicola CCALA 1050]MBW4589932.1 hypothetical protein [Aetokthonos hydrillicola CCALA 1050]MDR9895741.1 hypothetical protein [Aetokthonos hydrillicola Thurmond2011]